MKLKAPVCVFAYNRPENLKMVLEALKENDHANETPLYIYCDGLKKNASIDDRNKLNEVKKIAQEFNWVSDKKVIVRSSNLGLANSIVGGINEVLELHDKIIVLEDDIVPKKGFLEYMNTALNIYENESQVMHISAFIYPINKEGLANSFFYNVNSCWGWGTWKRAWKYYESDLGNLKNLFRKFNKKDFNKGQFDSFTWQLASNLNGNIKTWAVRWHASILFNGGFCLHPKHSLIENIGYGKDASHKSFFNRYISLDAVDYLPLEKIPVEENKLIIQRVSKYFWLRNLIFKVPFARYLIAFFTEDFLMTPNQVVIAIPAYKAELTDSEIKSLIRLNKILGEHKTYLFSPAGLNVSAYKKYHHNLDVKYFNPKYFRSIQDYNTLMLSSSFYKAFIEFKYMLLFQLDCYVFEDHLVYWCEKNYDYIGAPWIEMPEATSQRPLSFRKFLFKKVGNGGFSLRNVKKLYRNLLVFSPIAFLLRRNEDAFISLILPLINPFFRIPKWKEALGFCMELNPKKSFELNNNKLPFGVHAWEKYDHEFWQKHFDEVE